MQAFYLFGRTIFNNIYTEFKSKLTKLDLDKLPPNIKELDCSNNYLTYLNIHSNLIKLYCSNNKLTKLNILSSNLAELFCNNNKLIVYLLNQIIHLPIYYPEKQMN